ncbi:hypothetical protein [Roseateles puraquae]|uniref:Uncharacterized protein n=1 Tax=Roseateles puraquae TaxID=431059 RepID=A0A254NDM3_9BURK|nr:hypothetical protein [Roseateles puraquae]MDG0853573.1 hypothetical protein [Roseateles puraquae]OWR05744.1 hypothetical protein CDO81_04655 [Roseateles puraquae]
MTCSIYNNAVVVAFDETSQLQRRSVAARELDLVEDRLTHTRQDLEALSALRDSIRVDLEHLRIEHARMADCVRDMRAERAVLERAVALFVRRVGLKLA